MLFLKNESSQTVATAWIVPKICHGQPPTFGSHSSRSHPNRFTFGGVIAECVKTVFAHKSIYNIGSEPIITTVYCQ